MHASGVASIEAMRQPGADPGLRRAEGGANIFGVFRVKNHDFRPKNHNFFQLPREARKFLGVFRVKNHDFTPKNHIFPILGRPARRPP